MRRSMAKRSRSASGWQPASAPESVNLVWQAGEPVDDRTAGAGLHSEATMSKQAPTPRTAKPFLRQPKDLRHIPASQGWTCRSPANPCRGVSRARGSGSTSGRGRSSWASSWPLIARRPRGGEIGRRTNEPRATDARASSRQSPHRSSRHDRRDDLRTAGAPRAPSVTPPPGRAAHAGRCG